IRSEPPSPPRGTPRSPSGLRNAARLRSNTGSSQDLVGTPGLRTPLGALGALPRCSRWRFRDLATRDPSHGSVPAGQALPYARAGSIFSATGTDADFFASPAAALAKRVSMRASVRSIWTRKAL